MLASLIWVAAVAFYASREHDRDMLRLNLWADAVEGIIDGHPMLPVSAKGLRAKLGDERFIAEAAHAYPQVDLRETLRRYGEDIAGHPFHKHPLGAFATRGLIPPGVLYLLGALADWLGTLRRRFVGASDIG